MAPALGLANDEMQRTSHGQTGGSPLISVFARPMAAVVTPGVVLAIIWPDHGVRDHLGAVRHQGARCATG